jgi:sigma54-dependent transcription regulator
MTKSVDERARTIVKFIHIAAHARQMQNYATMYQITIALLTADIARLRKSWELVNPIELKTFRELEALVQPVRNFHNLRVEMDKVTGETGCIPFVGM